jgi:hypothetical protein
MKLFIHILREGENVYLLFHLLHDLGLKKWSKNRSEFYGVDHFTCSVRLKAFFTLMIGDLLKVLFTWNVFAFMSIVLFLWLAFVLMSVVLLIWYAFVLMFEVLNYSHDISLYWHREHGYTGSLYLRLGQNADVYFPPPFVTMGWWSCPRHTFPRRDFISYAGLWLVSFWVSG